MACGDSLWSLDSVMRRNVRTGVDEVFKVDGNGRSVALFEPTFAPRSANAPEGDGYLIVPVALFMVNTSEYQIFDTQDFTAGPIARIELPFQIGWTPHGHYLSFDRN
jgi:carotenoid cleavage dioxygenase